MPKRPDPAAALDREATPRGREAVYAGGRSNGAAPVVAERAASWEERHRRVTFHCPVELLEKIEAEVAGGRKKNAVIVDALTEHLGR